MARSELTPELQAALLAIRAQAIALVAQVDAVIEGHGCPHRNATETTTLASPTRTFFCKDCQVEYEQPWETEDVVSREERPEPVEP